MMSTINNNNTEPAWKTKCTTCACGNCTSAPGRNPNESCCFCNGSCTMADFYKDNDDMRLQMEEELAVEVARAKHQQTINEFWEKRDALKARMNPVSSAEQMERDEQDRVNEKHFQEVVRVERERLDKMEEEDSLSESDNVITPEYIGAINRTNNHRYLAIVVGGMAMGVLLEDVPFEGISTEAEAREAVRRMVEEVGW